MTYKLYRCGNRYDGRPGKLTFITRDPDFNKLYLRAVIEADILLRFKQNDGESPSKPHILYCYRSPSGEPVFAISSHNPPTKGTHHARTKADSAGR